MQVKLSVIVSHTEFKFGGSSYRKGNLVRSARQTNDYLGVRMEVGGVIQCAPKLGGQFQPDIAVWISEATIVEVS